MKPTWIEMTTALAAVGSLLVTSFGLIGLYVQVRKLQEATWSDAQSRLTEQSLSILRFMAEKPETYEYFYMGKALAADAPQRSFILYCAEAIANFMELLVLQKSNLPADQWTVWERFIRSSYESSVVIQEFLAMHRSWYNSELIALVADCDRHPEARRSGGP